MQDLFNKSIHQKNKIYRSLNLIRIAIVVHNEVRKDARVLKGANTLCKSGHDVKIFGLTTQEGGEDFTVEPHNISVKLSYRSAVGSDDTLLQKPPVYSKVQEPLDITKFVGGPSTVRESQLLRSFTHQGLIIADAVINDGEYDVIHIYDHVALTGASLYKNYLDIPLIWDAHEIYEDLAGTDPARGNTNAGIVQSNSRMIDAFITIYDSISKFYADKYKYLASAAIMPNASLWSERPEYDGRLHKATGLDISQKFYYSKVE